MHSAFNALVWGGIFLYVLVRFIQSIRMVPTQSAYIVERLGKYHATLGPGFHFLIPFVDRVAYVQDLKEEAIDVPPQECFTRDNVKVEVDGILYLSVVNPVAASYGITNFRYAAIQLVQTTTRSVIGTLDLDRTFEERDAVNARVIGVLSEVGEAWGIRVHRYEVKGIVPPVSVRNAMERQMTAERERRALLARSEGEKTTRINDSEGAMQEAINRSEGEKKRRINEAQGRAAEILAVARATAESIEKIGAMLATEGGQAAVQLRLGQQYLGALSGLARPETGVLLPADLTRFDELLGAVQLSPRPEPTPPPAFAARPPGATPPGAVIAAAPRPQVVPRPVAPASAAPTQPELRPVPGRNETER